MEKEQISSYPSEKKVLISKMDFSIVQFYFFNKILMN